MRILHWSSRANAIVFTGILLLYLVEILRLDGAFATALLGITPLLVLACFLTLQFPLLAFLAYLTAAMTYFIKVPSCATAITHACFWPLQGILIVAPVLLIDGILHKSTYRP